MITLIVTLILIGFFAWLAITYIPMAEPFPRLIIGFSILLAALCVLNFFGIIGSGPYIHARW